MKKDRVMESVRELYRIGVGPSSSHTLGPESACRIFKEKNSSADSFEVTLFGSLAFTGNGHETDTVIYKTFEPLKCNIIYNTEENDLLHPNTMLIKALKNNIIIDETYVYSVGGGKIIFEGNDCSEKNIYPLHSYAEISLFCKENDIRLWQYVELIEGKEIWDFFEEIWTAMKKSIKNGLNAEGIMPGKLELQRKAKFLHNQSHIDETNETRENRLVCSYAYAVSEENACGGTIVTAPTCGSCGVVPAVLYYQQKKRGYSDEEITHALATASIIGNLIKTNASISGAECGCQAEIGTACSMASAALGELFEMNIEQIEYAAEVALEHHLGLTCDPIYGLVQIPCIERNAVAAMRAINAVNLANFLTQTRKISFDLVVKTMYETGIDMHGRYRETSKGGLAKYYNRSV